MKFNVKNLLLIGGLLLGLFGAYKMTFGACCDATAATSGCTPSNCRGAKTKFGEAKVISELRLNLIDLKAELEASKTPAFAARTYDMHDIIGDSEEESLEIIIDEVKIIETDLTEKLNHQPTAFNLPENKAKQIQYLSTRIEGLKKLL